MDETDRQILDLLVEDARMPLTDIAREVGLSPAPVKRRIDRLKADGVIERFTAVVNYVQTGSALEAFAEVKVVGATDVETVFADLRKLPEVTEAYTMAGDTDALVRFRVENVQDLQRVLNLMRRSGTIAATKTMIIIDEMRR